MLVKEVKNIKDIELIETMAKNIWMECFINMISIDQIEYMTKKYLSVEAIKSYITDNYIFKLIISDADIIGFYSYKDMGEYIFLSKLYLKKEFRKNGFATEIIKILKEYNKPIKLNVNKNNILAIPFYIKVGFIITESVKTDIGSGYYMDDYVMILK